MANGEVWKTMEDLTIIYLTANKVPKEWAKYQLGVLKDAIGDAKVISVSYEPMDFGTNLIQTEYSLENLFKQYVRACKVATTPYIAIAEDDTLYTKEHFDFRPPMDKVAYDLNRWIIFTWGEPFYFHKPQSANGGLIAPRELFIKACEEKLTKDPKTKGLYKEVGRGDWEKYCGLTQWKTVTFYGKKPFLCFNHDYSVDAGQVAHNKKIGNVQAYDIPVWGRAENIRKKFI